MKRKIGVITIGQSPREDVLAEMRPLLGENIEVLQAGALDGLTQEEVALFVPRENDIVLVSKLRNGNSVKFGESYILPRLQQCIEKLEGEGAELIAFICTGKFPTEFSSDKIILYPQPLLHAVVPNLALRGKIGVINPDQDQIQQCLEIWEKSVPTVEAVVGSPYGDIQHVMAAAKELSNKDVDIIVMDCIGYTVQMKDIVSKITGKPVILARTLVARIIREMLD